MALPAENLCLRVICRFVVIGMCKLRDNAEHYECWSRIDYSVRDYYEITADVTGYSGEFEYDYAPTGRRKVSLQQVGLRLGMATQNLIRAWNLSDLRPLHRIGN